MTKVVLATLGSLTAAGVIGYMAYRFRTSLSRQMATRRARSQLDRLDLMSRAISHDLYTRDVLAEALAEIRRLKHSHDHSRPKVPRTRGTYRRRDRRAG